MKKTLLSLCYGLVVFSLNAYAYIDPGSRWRDVGAAPIESYVAMKMPSFKEDLGNNVDTIKIIIILADIDGDGDKDLFISDSMAENGRNGYFWNYYIYDSDSGSYWTWLEYDLDYVVANVSFRTDMLSIGYHDELNGYGMLAMVPAASGGTVYGFRVVKGEGGYPYLREVTDIKALDFNLDDQSKREASIGYLKDKLAPSGFVMKAFTLGEYNKGLHHKVISELGEGDGALPDNLRDRALDTEQSDIGDERIDGKHPNVQASENVSTQTDDDFDGGGVDENTISPDDYSESDGVIDFVMRNLIYFVLILSVFVLAVLEGIRRNR